MSNPGFMIKTMSLVSFFCLGFMASSLFGVEGDQFTLAKDGLREGNTDEQLDIFLDVPQKWISVVPDGPFEITDDAGNVAKDFNKVFALSAPSDSPFCYVLFPGNVNFEEKNDINARMNVLIRLPNSLPSFKSGNKAIRIQGAYIATRATEYRDYSSRKYPLSGNWDEEFSVGKYSGRFTKHSPEKFKEVKGQFEVLSKKSMEQAENPGSNKDLGEMMRRVNQIMMLSRVVSQTSEGEIPFLSFQADDQSRKLVTYTVDGAADAKPSVIDNFSVPRLIGKNHRDISFKVTAIAETVSERINIDITIPVKNIKYFGR